MKTAFEIGSKLKSLLPKNTNQTENTVMDFTGSCEDFQSFSFCAIYAAHDIEKTIVVFSARQGMNEMLKSHSLLSMMDMLSFSKY